MAQEIELKIKLNQSNYERLFSFLQNKQKVEDVFVLADLVLIKKSDEYYSRYQTKEKRKKNGEPQVIRIRTEQKNNKTESFFTIKRKTKENGIEFNEEKETFIQEKEVLQDLLSVAGYTKYFSKIKEAYSTYCSLKENKEIEFHVELEKVNQFYYVEIEYTKEGQDPKYIASLLEKLVIALGLNLKDKDSRSWMKILQEES